MEFNTITGLSGGIGLKVFTSGTLSVLFNNFTNNAQGVRAGQRFTGSLKLQANNINGNSLFGLFNNSPTLIDARFNWWGSLTGPTNPANPRGMGDTVSGNVNFSGFLLAPISI